MKTYRYQSDSKTDAILCDSRGDGNRTYVIHETQMPASASKIAQLMNEAWSYGYQQAQADICKSLGMTR